jgi:hypothetical protein
VRPVFSGAIHVSPLSVLMERQSWPSLVRSIMWILPDFVSAMVGSPPWPSGLATAPKRVHVWPPSRDFITPPAFVPRVCSGTSSSPVDSCNAIGAGGVIRLVELHRLRPCLGRVAAAAEVDVDLRIEAGEEQEGLFPGDEQRRIEVGPAREVLQDGRLAPSASLIR